MLLFLLSLASCDPLTCPASVTGLTGSVEFCFGSKCDGYNAYNLSCYEALREELSEITTPSRLITTLTFRVTSATDVTIDLSLFSKVVQIYQGITVQGMSSLKNALEARVKFGLVQLIAYVYFKDLVPVVIDAEGTMNIYNLLFQHTTEYLGTKAAGPRKAMCQVTYFSYQFGGTSVNRLPSSVFDGFEGIVDGSKVSVATGKTVFFTEGSTSTVILPDPDGSATPEFAVAKGSIELWTITAEGFTVTNPLTGSSRQILNRGRRGISVTVESDATMKIGCTEDFVTIDKSLYDKHLQVKSSGTVVFVESEWPRFDFSVVELDNTGSGSVVMFETEYTSLSIVNDVSNGALRLYMATESRDRPGLLDSRSTIFDSLSCSRTCEVFFVNYQKLEVSFCIRKLNAGAMCTLTEENNLVTVNLGEVDSLSNLMSYTDISIVITGKVGQMGGYNDRDLSSSWIYYNWISSSLLQVQKLAFRDNAYLNFGSSYMRVFDRNVKFDGGTFYLDPRVSSAGSGDPSCNQDPSILLCQPDLDCNKFHVMLKRGAYYDYGDTEYDHYADPYEQVCLDGISLSPTDISSCGDYNFIKSADRSKLRCVGYKWVNGYRRHSASFSVTDANYAKWQANVHEYTRSVTMSAGVSAHKSLNFDMTELSGASLVASSGIEVLSVDMTEATAGKLSSITTYGTKLDIRSPLEFDIPVSVPELRVPGGFATDNLSRFDFSGVNTLEIPLEDYDNYGRSFSGVNDLTLTGIKEYDNVHIRPDDTVLLYGAEARENMTVLGRNHGKLKLGLSTSEEVNILFDELDMSVEIAASNVRLPNDMPETPIPLKLSGPTGSPLTISTRSEFIPVEIECFSLTLNNDDYFANPNFTARVKVTSGSVSFQNRFRSVYFADLAVDSRLTFSSTSTELPRIGVLEYLSSPVNLPTDRAFEVTEWIRFTGENAAVTLSTAASAFVPFDENVRVELVRSVAGGSAAISFGSGTPSVSLKTPAELLVRVNHPGTVLDPPEVWEFRHAEDDPVFESQAYAYRHKLVCAKKDFWNCEDWKTVTHANQTEYVFDEVKFTPRFECTKDKESFVWKTSTHEYDWEDCLDMVLESSGGDLKSDNSNFKTTDGEIGAVVIVSVVLVLIVAITAGCTASCCSKKKTAEESPFEA